MQQAQQQQPLSQQDFQNLLACLQNALNANPEVQKQAEAFLSSLDSRPGFSSALAVRCTSGWQTRALAIEADTATP